MTQRAAARGNFTSADATSPDTVELGVRMVVRSVADANTGDVVDVGRGHSYKLCARLVCKFSLDSDSYEALQQMTPCSNR